MTIHLGKDNKEISKIVSYGSENNTILDHFCALLLAISPILQHYRGLYENAGFTVYLIVFPILCLRFLGKVRTGKYSSRCIMAMLPLLLYEFYTAIIHTSSVARILYILFMIFVFLCVACGCINVIYYLKYATMVATVAGGLLILQYISYYVFHYPINLEPHAWLVDQNSSWIKQVVYSSSRLYRPSAFFLEPSHLFLYCFPLICIYLLSTQLTEWRKKKAIFLSVAILLSTSGMGIAVVAGLWFLYYVFYSEANGDYKLDLRKLFSSRTLIIMLLIIAVFIAAYLFIPFIREGVTRIFYNASGSTAIEGRVRLAQNYVSQISGKAIWFGEQGVTSELEFNLSGFFATYIKWGVVGIILTYWFYGQGLFKLKRAYFWLTFVIIVISYFTAHTHGTFYMMYFVILLINGYNELSHTKEKRLSII